MQKINILKLSSPVFAERSAPYENPWDSSEDYIIMTETEKKKCMTEIGEKINEIITASDYGSILTQFSCDESDKIVSADLTTEINEGRVMLALNCRCISPLSESELDELCGRWEKIVVSANEKLRKCRVQTKKYGRIKLHIWSVKGWAIEPEYQYNRMESV